MREQLETAIQNCIRASDYGDIYSADPEEILNAVLDALMEPTDDMLDAAEEVVEAWRVDIATIDSLGREDVKRVLQAAVNAAKTGK